MSATDIHHLEGAYALAIERQDYRRAAWFAIRGLRRLHEKETWKWRLQGCLKRRHT